MDKLEFFDLTRDNMERVLNTNILYLSDRLDNGNIPYFTTKWETISIPEFMKKAIRYINERTIYNYFEEDRIGVRPDEDLFYMNVSYRTYKNYEKSYKLNTNKFVFIGRLLNYAIKNHKLYMIEYWINSYANYDEHYENGKTIPYDNLNYIFMNGDPEYRILKPIKPNYDLMGFSGNEILNKIIIDSTMGLKFLKERIITDAIMGLKFNNRIKIIDRDNPVKMTKYVKKEI